MSIRSDPLSAPRIVTEPLGGSALARAVVAGALGADVAPPLPRAVDAWRRRIGEVQAGGSPSWLDALRGAFGGHGGAIARLERTVAAGGVVVTTGQQAGLFGGPIYTWSKAVGALALADALERETGVPVAPIFWAATDDADFTEADHTTILVDGAARTLRTGRAPAPGTPMSAAALGDVSPLLHELRAACGSMAYAHAWHAVEAAYTGGSVGGAYVTLLRALLEPLGIAVLDSSHREVRAAGHRLLRLALERAAQVEAALEARHAWLSGAGFDAQVADVAGLSTVFVHEDGIKRRVPVKESARLAKAAESSALSPNVLLRPVMERAILPTVAYVAGPGELAYFAQVSAVAGALDAPQPLAVPRWSCTVVEPAVDRALARLGVGLDDMADATAIEGRVARAEVPVDVRAALEQLRASLTTGLDVFHAAERASDGGPLLADTVVDGTGRQIAFRLDRMERRLVAAAKRRGSDALRDLALARASLWPEGHRQERTLNFIPLLARYGPDLWTQMREAAGVHAASLIAGTPREA